MPAATRAAARTRGRPKRSWKKTVPISAPMLMLVSRGAAIERAPSPFHQKSATPREAARASGVPGQL
jgi:hypothetical protein